MAKIEVTEGLGFGEGHLHVDTTLEQAQEIAETINNKYLKKVSEHAPGQCMDGRYCKCTAANTETTLGPKLAGGPEQSGFAAAELTAGYYADDISEVSADRAVLVGEKLTTNGIAIGGHMTVAARENNYVNPKTGKPQTGCGAGETHTGATERIAKADENVIKTTQKLTGRTFDTSNVVPASTIEARNANYSPKDMLDIELAQNEGKSTEVLEGAHDERVLVLNWVRGTTVDRDALLKETGKGAFVVDMWYLEDVARAMVAGRPDANEMFSAIYDNLVAFQVAVYAELCDGSHPVISLSEQGDSATEQQIA